MSPKVSEVTVASAETFPLKKDEKLVKSTLKPVIDEKKGSSQKTCELTLSKKPIESSKKSKRDKRDESSDSEDSEDGI